MNNIVGNATGMVGNMVQSAIGTGGVQGNKTISGTWGSLWYDGEKIAECVGVIFNTTVTRAPVQIGLDEDTKITGLNGTGTITLQKTYSRANEAFTNAQKGIDKRFQIVSALEDPDAYGFERISCDGCWFNNFDFGSWQKGTAQQTQVQFGYPPTQLKFLDQINPSGANPQGISDQIERMGSAVGSAASGLIK